VTMNDLYFVEGSFFVFLLGIWLVGRCKSWIPRIIGLIMLVAVMGSLIYQVESPNSRGTEVVTQMRAGMRENTRLEKLSELTRQNESPQIEVSIDQSTRDQQLCILTSAQNEFGSSRRMEAVLGYGLATLPIPEHGEFLNHLRIRTNPPYWDNKLTVTLYDNASAERKALETVEKTLNYNQKGAASITIHVKPPGSQKRLDVQVEKF